MEALRERRLVRFWKTSAEKTFGPSIIGIRELEDSLSRAIAILTQESDRLEIHGDYSFLGVNLLRGPGLNQSLHNTTLTDQI
jgi:hypothetical protein